MTDRAYIDRALENLFAGRAPDPLPLKKADISKSRYFERDITLSGLHEWTEDDPGSDYRGYAEITHITFNGTVYPASDFPPEFVKALERELCQ